MKIKDIYLKEYVINQAITFQDELIKLVDKNIEICANALSGKIKVAKSIGSDYLKEDKLKVLFDANIILRKYINISVEKFIELDEDDLLYLICEAFLKLDKGYTSVSQIKRIILLIKNKNYDDFDKKQYDKYFKLNIHDIIKDY